MSKGITNLLANLVPRRLRASMLLSLVHLSNEDSERGGDDSLAKVRSTILPALFPPREEPSSDLISTLEKTGVFVSKKREDYHYVHKTYGCSSHKQRDIREIPDFGAVAEQVIRSGRTLLYYDRLYTLYELLARNLRDPALGAMGRNVVEVGVYKGGACRFLAEIASRMQAQDFRLYAFDTFCGHAEEDVERGVDTEHHPGLFSDILYDDVIAHLAPYPSVKIIKGRFQDNAGVLGDARIALVHLDVDLYRPTLFALRFFSSRMLVGGAIVVDDYGFTTCPGIRSAVDEFLGERPGFAALPLLTGQCVLIREGRIE